MPPVWEPHDQGVAGLTDPDDPILIHQELDRQAAREAQEEKERQREQERQERMAQRDAERAAARGAGHDTPSRTGAASRKKPKDRPQRPDADGDSDGQRPEHSDVITGHSGSHSSAHFLLLALVVVGAVAYWLFGPDLMPGKKKPASQSAPVAAAPGTLPVAPENGPLSNPMDVGRFGDRIPDDLVHPDLGADTPDEASAALPSASDNVSDASPVVASLPVPGAEVAAAADSDVAELATSTDTEADTDAAADDSADAELPSEPLEALAEGVAALTERIDALQARVESGDSFRMIALEQRMNVLQEQADALKVRAERAEKQSAAAQKAARAPARPRPTPAVAAKPKPKTKPAPKTAEKPKPAPRTDPGVQLLAIDSWAGQPSVIVGTTAPGAVRTRTLAVGDTINGITLQSVDTRTGVAVFNVGHGETQSLALTHSGAQP